MGTLRSRTRWFLPACVCTSFCITMGAMSLAASTTPPAADSATQSPRNIVLISVDTLRADALGFMGNEHVETPTLDRLAAEGLVFTNAHAHNVVTLPSHANMLTGRLPYEHGVRDNAGFVLTEDIPTLATLLGAEGFATAAFIGAFPLDSRFGLARGFDVYDDDYPVAASDQVFTFSERSGDEVVGAALRWWQDHADEPKLLFLHLFDPHAPYQAPEPFASRYADRPYLGEVSAVDGFLAPFLDELTNTGPDSSLVLFTSDHGEGLGDHGEDTHGLFAYESTLRVPLMIWGAGVAAGRDPSLVGHIDLLPTVLDALSLPDLDDLPGRSLLRHAPSETPRALYFEAFTAAFSLGWAPLRGTILGSDKLIDLPIPELYDLAADPAELDNRFAAERRRARVVANAISPASAWPPGRRAVIGSEEVKQLQSLGYVAGSAPIKRTFTPDDDPKNLVELDRKIRSAGSLYHQGRLDEAIVLLDAIIRERPTMPLVYRDLAELLRRKGRANEAVTVMLAAREREFADSDMLRELALTLTQLGRAPEALEILDNLPTADRDVEAEATRALALGMLGRAADAIAALEAILSEAPKHARAHETMAFILAEQGRFEDAARHARQATELAPERADAWNNLGVALYNLQQPVEAARAWQRALQLEPSNLDPLFNLAVAAAEAGNANAARKAFEHFLATARASRYGSQRQAAERILHELEG